MLGKKGRFFAKKDDEKIRINKQIKAPFVRLVIEGEGARIVSLQEALKIADEKGLDLVEVSPNQDPPVCKIIDYGKWKFEQTKKKKEQQKKQHVIEIKELNFSPLIGEHDYQIKLRKAKEFIEEGNKVKIILKFKGRQIEHPEIGIELLNRFIADTSEFSKLEVAPKKEGRIMTLIIAPKGNK